MFYLEKRLEPRIVHVDTILLITSSLEVFTTPLGAHYQLVL